MRLVFGIAASLALLALALVWRLREEELDAGAPGEQRAQAPAGQAAEPRPARSAARTAVGAAR